jgi:hypothetical protein
MERKGRMNGIKDRLINDSNKGRERTAVILSLVLVTEDGVRIGNWIY